jgi:thymidine kinase
MLTNKEYLDKLLSARGQLAIHSINNLASTEDIVALLVELEIARIEKVIAVDEAQTQNANLLEALTTLSDNRKYGWAGEFRSGAIESAERIALAAITGAKGEP